VPRLTPLRASLYAPRRSSTRAFQTLLLQATTTAALSLAGAAHAADAPAESVSTIGEVVVTAERRSDSVLHVPLAVTAIGGDDLAAKHISHLVDLSAQIPNVEISSARGSGLTDVVIRGVGVANDFSLNQASPVGTYVDDSYMASRAFSGAQAFDLERVEVLRGPQGTLFGRNTTGGLINYITRAPGLDGDGGRVEAGLGAFQDVRVQGAAEHTFVPGVFGVRAAATFQRHDGYFHNIVPGQPDPEDLKTWAGRVESRWKPTEALDITLRAYGQREQNLQWNTHTKALGATEETPPGKFNVSVTPGRSKTSSEGAQLKVAATLAPGWTLTHLTSVDRGKVDVDNVDEDGHADDATTPGHLHEFQATGFRQLNEELRVNYEGQALRAVAGAYFGRDEVRSDLRYEIFTAFPLSPHIRYEQVRESRAAFGQLDYTRGPLTLAAGLRFTHDSAVYRNGHADVTVPLVPGGVINTLPGAGSPGCPALTCPDAVQPTERGSSDALTGRAALRYEIDAARMVYASYSRGYRSGAFNGIAYLSPAQLFFVKPEVVNAYEIGAKGRFLGGRLRVSAAAFFNDYRNQQVNFLRSEVTALGPFPVNILDNVSKARTRGLEFEGDFAASDRLALHAAVGLLEAEYAQGASITGLDLSGKRLPYAPRASGSLGLRWQVADVAGAPLTLAPEVVYSSRYFFDPSNNPNVGTPGYTRVNATLSWEREGLSLALWGRNLFNQSYNDYGVDLSANTGFYFYSAAPPRTWGVTVARNF
jgi:iron complex outermembrane receptor protein